jgi:adenylate cyclase
MLGFGIPLAQEEHAMRALAAAATLRQRALDMPLGGAEPLVAARHLRVAVSTGLSVVASAEVAAAQPSHVFGEVGPDAQRLAAQAAPRTLVVNAAMAQLIHPMLPMEPPFSLANDAPASDVYCVTAEDIPYLSRPLRGARESSPFVGRDDDLAFLHTQLRQVRQGYGQVLGIMAEAGMGKSRLLREFRQSLEGQAIPP